MHKVVSISIHQTLVFLTLSRTGKSEVGNAA